MSAGPISAPSTLYWLPYSALPPKTADKLGASEVWGWVLCRYVPQDPDEDDYDANWVILRVLSHPLAQSERGTSVRLPARVVRRDGLPYMEEATVDDVSTLPYWNDPYIVHTLAQRWAQGQLQNTWISRPNVLVSLTPEKDPNDDSDDDDDEDNDGGATMELYLGQVGHGVVVGSESGGGGMATEEASLPPHAYAMANAAFRAMASLRASAASSPDPKRHRRHTLLVTPCPSPQKTTMTRNLIHYLTTLSQRVSRGDGQMERNVRHAYRILNALGTASGTARMAPWYELFFSCPTTSTRRGGICGAKVQVYGLERARVVVGGRASIIQTIEEEDDFDEEDAAVPGMPSHTSGVGTPRTFDIFHQLVAAASSSSSLLDTRSLMLDGSSSFRLIGPASSASSARDAKAFEQVHEAFRQVGMSADELSQVWQVLAAVLHASNITVTLSGGAPDGGSVGATNQAIGGELRADVHRTRTCQLLGLCDIGSSDPAQEDVLAFNGAICGKSVASRSHGPHVVRTKRVTADVAARQLQATLKSLYGSLVVWITRKLNDDLSGSSSGEPATQAAAAPTRGPRGLGARLLSVGPGAAALQAAAAASSEPESSSIGTVSPTSIAIVQNFGFAAGGGAGSEDLGLLDRLLTNYSREVIQSDFLRRFFVTEQEEYAREGISWSPIEVESNEDVVDGLYSEAAETGLLFVVEDESRRKRSSDVSLNQALYGFLTSSSGGVIRSMAEGASSLLPPSSSAASAASSSSSRRAVQFQIRHYGQDVPVSYDASHYWAQNSDAPPVGLVQLLRQSRLGLVRQLADIIRPPEMNTDPLARFGGGGDRSTAPVKSTAISQFRSDLQRFRRACQESHAMSFVYSISVPTFQFSYRGTLQQLHACGLLATSRMAALGYPRHLTHFQFQQQFQFLVASRELIRDSHFLSSPPETSAALARFLVPLLQQDAAQQRTTTTTTSGQLESGGGSHSAGADLERIGIQVGKTKVFLRQKTFLQLCRLREMALDWVAIKIQRAARRFLRIRQAAKQRHKRRRGPRPMDRASLSIRRGFDTTGLALEGSRLSTLVDAVVSQSRNGTEVVLIDQTSSAANASERIVPELGPGARLVSSRPGNLFQGDRVGATIGRDDFIRRNEDALNEAAEAVGSKFDFEANAEVGRMGGAWRGVLADLVRFTLDEVNVTRLTRGLQDFIPFLTSYEAYLIDQLIGAMEGGKKASIEYMLQKCFKNRNVSRILVQQMSRYDFLWHWHRQLTKSRLFDAWGQVPILGITSFPVSENFPSTRNHAIASIMRQVLGEGNWITRVVTGREGLIVDDDFAAAQNLAAESNGFEVANRNQWGTHYGRKRTNQFRLDHRLPTDESIVRTFVAQPLATMVNNGVVHTLRQLSKHWNNMLTQPAGNFAHQRMEQLDPFETLRFHMPIVAMVLALLRGLNEWDSRVLGPFVAKLQGIRHVSKVAPIKELLREMKEEIVLDLCAGVASRIDPLRSWLHAIDRSLDLIEEEAQEVLKIVDSVETGIRAGYATIGAINWTVPTEPVLKRMVLEYIRKQREENELQSEPDRLINRALQHIPPRDKRTLMELVTGGYAKSRPAQLLLGRATTLLVREMRREKITLKIRQQSVGPDTTTPVANELYWMERDGDVHAEDGTPCLRLYVCKGLSADKTAHVFVDTLSRNQVQVRPLDVGVRARLKEYIPLAESMSRAQKAFMTIELDHGKKFSYNAFMEFCVLRSNLRKLLVLAETHCEELDDARLRVLAEIQQTTVYTSIEIDDVEPGQVYYSYDAATNCYEPFALESKDDPKRQQYQGRKIVRVPPQSTIVLGAGPTGMTAAIHCTENVLLSGGVVKLFEHRDSFPKAASAFERAQIVRLDSRWIAMLRYHLGTGYEDVYIPASGETDSQRGNTLPTQGFVEITIKDLEDMLHVEISRMWAKGLMEHHTKSGAVYDVETNSLIKKGEALKVGDICFRKVDHNGRAVAAAEYSWRIVHLEYPRPVPPQQLVHTEKYQVYDPSDDKLHPYRLAAIDDESMTYRFRALDDSERVINTTAANLPTVYSYDTKSHSTPVEIVFVSQKQADRGGGFVQQTVPFSSLAKESVTLDIGHFHVVDCTGKPKKPKVHFRITTEEPYGVCCIQGLKISMGMHNFGETRWGKGILDDIRSHSDQNTRIVGDFTKSVRAPPIAQRMHEYMTDEKDRNWYLHFHKLFTDAHRIDADLAISHLVEALSDLKSRSSHFVRDRLQTRFFETGDNYYLGMEFNREYDSWKQTTARDIVALGRSLSEPDVRNLRRDLEHAMDRLWYDATLETIRLGDVYNPGARHRIPRLYLVNAQIATSLGSLPVGESFRIVGDPRMKYEVVMNPRSGGGGGGSGGGKSRKSCRACSSCCCCSSCCRGLSCCGGSSKDVVVRNVEGYISRFAPHTEVKREGNLTRKPDGNYESNVALATFPVGHYVNHRTLRVNDKDRGYVFCFAGDNQSTPHFMRYSGLTGACINAMLFNNFVGGAVRGEGFVQRFGLYSRETNWSNSEVVTRGTGGQYGEDGFLRPGFPYEKGLDYLYSKVIEYRESGQDPFHLLSDDWKVKFAGALVPRGLETNADFLTSLKEQLHKTLLKKFFSELEKDSLVANSGIIPVLQRRSAAMSGGMTALERDSSFWMDLLDGVSVDDPAVAKALKDPYLLQFRALAMALVEILDFAAKEFIFAKRISSELENEPKPVDSVIDDFAVEAQNFTNSLARSAAFAAGALAFAQHTGSNFFGALLGFLNIFIAFGTMTNISRYRIRNEEARVDFYDKKLLSVLAAVYGCMSPEDRSRVANQDNPYYLLLQEKRLQFKKFADYYDYEQAHAERLLASLDRMCDNINHVPSIEAFMRELTTIYIPDTYHESSYVQEYLVDIYKVLGELRGFLLAVTPASSSSPPPEAGGGVASFLVDPTAAVKAKQLFYRLHSFSPRLTTTLQRGSILWGFIKKRAIWQWDVSMVPRYLMDKLYRLLPARFASRLWCAPISVETRALLAETTDLAHHANHNPYHKESFCGPAMNRAKVEMRELYHATKESYTASVIFVTATLVFVASIIFSIARIFRVDQAFFQDLAAVSLLLSLLGVLLAVSHLFRKWRLQWGLDRVLGKSLRASGVAMSEEMRDELVYTRHIARIGELITAVRVVSAILAAIALPLAIRQTFRDENDDVLAQNNSTNATLVVEEEANVMMTTMMNATSTTSDDDDNDDDNLAFLLALLSFLFAVASTVLLLFFEYVVLFQVKPRLGEFLCEGFRDELERTYQSLEFPKSDFVATKVQERVTWEYTAREFLHKYRFDTVFMADRFGPLLQYIQSGMNPREGGKMEV